MMKTTIRTTGITTLIAVAMAIGATPASAELYVYIDDEGNQQTLGADAWWTMNAQGRSWENGLHQATTAAEGILWSNGAPQPGGEELDSCQLPDVDTTPLACDTGADGWFPWDCFWAVAETTALQDDEAIFEAAEHPTKC